MCGIATITPTGAHKAITNLWNVLQKKQREVFVDGQLSASNSSRLWTSDGPDTVGLNKTILPDNNDKLYTIDAPGFTGGTLGATNSLEVYDNFYDYITWNSQICCDTNNFWYFHAKWNYNQTPEYNPADVGPGTINFP